MKKILRFTHLSSLLLFVMLGIGFLSTQTAMAGGNDSLYYICDGGDRLWIINKADGVRRDIGPLGVPNVETMAYAPGTDVIYAADAGTFGTVNIATGAFTSIGQIDGGGTADGSIGPQTLNDVDGMSIDPWTGVIWASNRRAGDYDLMFQINRSTGLFIPDAFGPGIDYLVIDGSGVFQDIDDIAISPVNGQMYTTSTQGGSGQMLAINKYTGAVSILANTQVNDLEGLAYSTDGNFWGVDGTTSQLVQVDPFTGQTILTYDISDANCSDPESIGALIASSNLVQGKVWDDIDLDQVIDAGEVGIQNVQVHLYVDMNANGVIDLGDIRVQTKLTDASGDYEFRFAAEKSLIVVTEFNSLPSGYGYTTDNIETAVFTTYGQTDANNNFGAANGPDSDGDGIPDLVEGTTPDSDNDGIPNYLDIDSDNDGILDSDEGMADNDFDGVPNYIDLDSDNDGIPDAIEANDGIAPTNYVTSLGRIVDADADNDGLVDCVDNAPNTQYTAASTSTSPNNDADGDGVPNYTDLDSDGDGILDLIEAGGVDADQDGRYDGFSDGNGDGYFDGSNLNPLPITNTDAATETANSLPLRPDFLDLDSDSDGIDDFTEGFATGLNVLPSILNDCDLDGVIDFWDADKGGVPAEPHDMDMDGIPDYRDTDTDGDGVDDIIEGNDADLNGVADSSPSGNDTDGDGIDDTFDGNPTVYGGGTNVPLQNQDGDAQPDWRDRDDTLNSGVFYYVCDATDQLYTVDVNSGVSTLVGPLGVPDIEAIANWPSGGLGLYGTDAGDFGSINTTTGAFSFIAEVDGGGTANGSLGAMPFNDIDGLSFDPWTGILWATERRSGAGLYDLLFQINPVTGLFVPDIFGVGVDYLVIDGAGVYDDIDDLAISPTDGKLYTVGNNGSQDQLLNISKYTGAVTLVDALSENDVEGMAYHNSGTYYGTLGTTPGEWFEIDPTNGNMTDQIILACGDPEGNSALLAPVNVITGKVWDDVDVSQTINGGEVGIAGVTVNLYIDVNNDNLVDGGDILIQSIQTDGNGDYTFEFATTGQLVMDVDITTLPAGYALTTDNVEEVSFLDNFNFGELDANNNFGATGGSDCDGDGLPDFAEGGVGVDSDGDGVDNMCDLDSDNDGILDALENLGDFDGDGVADFIDLDSDNDGIPDAIEGNDGVAPASYVPNTGRLSGADSDGDGLLDAVDAAPGVPYGPTSTSSLPNNDNDGDGRRDFRDLDSDNDGIFDVIEAGGVDANGDAQQDGFSDGNGDGIGDLLNTTPLLVPNTDGTGKPDYIDWDSDGDGLDDTLEGMSTTDYATPPVFSDADRDGIWDYWDPTFGGAGIVPVDTDGDGTADFRDLDSDNDSVLDIIEGNDANMDGVADFNPTGTDSDGDGLDDAYDANCVGGNIIVNATDHAEENVSTGAVNLTSSDVELAIDGTTNQYAAFLFNGLNIAQGATVPTAYIQFQADEVQTGTVNLTIRGQAIDNPVAFTTTTNDVSNRTTTTASVTGWNPANWNTVGEAGANQRSPSITGILQEIVNRPGWVSGNDVVIIITGTGSNRRTAEVNPTIVMAGNSYGCSTIAPHQDTDSDGAHDWRDTEDDGDGILTIDEVPDVNPANGIPDYLELAVCPPGQTLATVTTSGNADAVVASNNITNVNNSLGAPDGSIATFANNNNSRVDLDLTDVLPAGTTLAVRWRKVSGGGDAELEVFWSATGTGGWNSIVVLATSSTSLITSNVNIPNDARYFRFNRARREPGLDAVSYSFTTQSCVPDFDQDGIPDVTDIDDDNDGIPDIMEVGDKDGDGQIDALDLDSDNDGLPDALEANAGVLPANMTGEGQYPGGYVSTNDANGDGLANDVDPTFPGGVPLADTDTDLDGCPNRCSLDSDGDGITDAVEANTGVLPANMNTLGQYPAAYAMANDIEPDGLVDDVDPDAGGVVLPNPDTDGDGIPNFMDLDSDGDLISDHDEGFTSAPPLTGDGNGNCLDDAYEVPGQEADLPDLDCNGIPDYLDIVRVTAQSGNYNDPATWVGGTVPTILQSISILDGHVITLTGNTQTATITIAPTGSLEIETYNLTITGSFLVQGSFTATAGQVSFAGSGCPQVICGGTIVFHDWEVNNVDGVDADCGGVCWTGVYTPTAGTLDVCDANVCMIATTDAVASVSGSGTGDITCPITIEQYKDGCVTQDGFFGLTSPVSGMTIETGWDDDLTTTGYTDSDYPNFAFNNTTWYFEPATGLFDAGWANPSTTAQVIERGRGYMIWAGPGELPVTIDLLGTPDFNPFNFPLTYTSTGNSNDDGYNYLGNPYTASIRWNLNPGNGWNNVGCCDAIFVWDECNQQYAAYSGGVGTNGGTDIIAQSQAFWVKAHVPGSSLGIDRTAMVSDPGDFRNSQMAENHDVFYIDLENGNYYDQIAIRLADNATGAFDDGLDAFKFFSPDSLVIPNIFSSHTNPNDTMAMSINSLPYDNTSRVVPVSIIIKQAGNYNLDFSWLGNTWPQNMCVYVEDLVTGAIIDPRATNVYSFVANSFPNNAAEHRFDVHFKYALEVTTQDVVCNRATDGFAAVEILGSGPFDVIWTDPAGNILQSTYNTMANTDTLLNIGIGTYNVSVTDHGSSVCSDFNKTVDITGPALPVNAAAIITHATCGAENDGAINVVVTGGVGPFSYVWAHGPTTQDVSGLPFGNYTINITDANGCTENKTFVIENRIDPVSASLAAPDSVFLSNGGFASFINTSQGASAYVWYFGDDSTSVDMNPVHQYDSVGTYTVMLVSYNGHCSDTAYHTINVGEIGTGIAPVFGGVTNIYEQNGMVYLWLDLEAAANVRVEIMNNLGEAVRTKAYGTVSQLTQTFNMKDVESGVYYIRVTAGDQTMIQKVLLTN